MLVRRGPQDGARQCKGLRVAQGHGLRCPEGGKRGLKADPARARHDDQVNLWVGDHLFLGDPADAVKAVGLGWPAAPSKGRHEGTESAHLVDEDAQVGSGAKAHHPDLLGKGPRHAEDRFPKCAG